jgi:FtsP/CotA-like multicopper oxidase with cupredoxin domain
MKLRVAPGLLAVSAAALALAPGTAGRESATGRTLQYWIAAVPVKWNVVPNERDAIDDVRFRPEETTFETVVYKAYTRGWDRPLRDVPGLAGDNDGIPGPLLRARVGDTVLVHFKNLDTLRFQPHSMHFHGFRYDFTSDGSFIPGFSTRGANVAPGESFTYRLKAIPGSAGVWPYHDHSPSMTQSIEGGMYGAISILGAKQRRPDHEFVVFLSSHLKFMTINGRAFVGNTPVLHARRGDVVQWDVLAIGDDHHTFHLHGHRWRNPDRTFIDTRTLGPAESFSFRIREDVPGTWLYHCHVEGHMMRGMIGIYRVSR